MSSAIQERCVNRNFFLSQRSFDRLKGVHPDLVNVVKRAIELTTVDFAVTEGLRDCERQKQCLDKGTSKTLNGRHLTGHAVDLTPYNVQGKAITGPLGDDPANWHYFHTLARFMKMASIERKVPIEWGGDWKSPVDGYHFELTWRAYPLR